jgi:hypothetical protein
MRLRIAVLPCKKPKQNNPFTGEHCQGRWRRTTRCQDRLLPQPEHRRPKCRDPVLVLVCCSWELLSAPWPPVACSVACKP